jgi:hypothetical protein
VTFGRPNGEPSDTRSGTATGDVTSQIGARSLRSTRPAPVRGWPHRILRRCESQYLEAFGRRPEYCAPVVNRDLATILLHAFADAHPLTPRGVKEALERVKMLPAASGSPGTRLPFGKWIRRGWMGPGYLVARQLEPEFRKSRLVGRFGEL